MTINSYRDLDAWRLGMDLAEAVYHVTKQFPPEERFGLASQLRRSAVGIPSNVAEGHQLGTRSYRRFVTIALGCARSVKRNSSSLIARNWWTARR